MTINITHFDHLCLIQSIPSVYKEQIQIYNQNADQNYGILVNDICSKKKKVLHIHTQRL
jgi:hypothetical protein